MDKMNYYTPKEMMEYLRDKALDAIGQIVYGDLYTIPTEEKVPRIEGIFDLLISVAEEVNGND